ncbi:sigma factor [Ectobacillus funiculus]|uniref:sigma factor n=1 Tax=Bacillaceae TaxID=186817 RepID=UPI00101DC9D3
MKNQNEYDQLIQLTLSGKKEAYGELYERTIQDVYKTVHFLIEERTDVDDLVQDIYIEVYQSLNQFDRNKPLPVEVGRLPKELQGEFQQARDFIDYVNNKQQAVKE